MFVIFLWIISQSFLTFLVNYIFQISYSPDFSPSLIPQNPTIIIALNYISMFLLLIPVYLILFFKTSSTGFSTLTSKIFRIYLIYSVLSSISDLANLYCLTGIAISSYLVLLNLFIPMSALWARIICSQKLSVLQWLILTAIVICSVNIQAILEPDLISNVTIKELPYYLALLATITLDSINMNLLTREISRNESGSSISATYQLFVIYAFCLVSTLILLMIFIFIYPNDMFFNIWIYVYCPVYAANTLVYVYICRVYDPIVFTLSGVLSIFWSIMVNPEILTLSVSLSCFTLLTCVGIYIKSRRDTRDEILIFRDQLS